jgi:hypothetical protein
MGSQKKSRFWRICRVYFRGFRILVWLSVLVALTAVIYLNQIGLPEVLKRPLLDKLRDRGLDLKFSRLRLSWYEGIVAENVHFGPADVEFSPHLKVAEVRVRLNWGALAHRQLQVDSLILRQGQVSWAFPDTNRAIRELSITNIQTDLRFLPEDKWSLDNFRAQFAGARVQLSGVVTNASAIRDWKILQGQQPASPSAELWQNRLRRIAHTMNRIHFSAPPEMRMIISGDALDFHTFRLLLSLSAPGAETPWGTVNDGHFIARLFSVDSNGVSRADLDLKAAGAQTPWGGLGKSSLTLHLATGDSQTNLVMGEVKVISSEVHTEWAQASNAVFTAIWTHAITNPIPITGEGHFQCDSARTRWANASGVQLRASLAQTESAEIPADPAMAWWTNLRPYRLSWDCRLADLVSPQVRGQNISCAGDWRPFELIITNLDASAFGGRVSATAELNASTRATHLKLVSNCDAHELAALFSKDARTWLDQLHWPVPPRLDADLSLTLPAWTNRNPDWSGQVLPGAVLSGELRLPRGGGFRQLQITSAQTHFSYSNQCWYLPDFKVTRPEGSLGVEQRYNELTQEFYTRLTSTIDPSIGRPFLSKSSQEVFDVVIFSNAPAISLKVWGKANDPSHWYGTGSITGSNFSVRGERFSSVTTRVFYTNNLIRFLKPRVEIGPRYLQADGLTVDLARQFVYLTNGFSVADPMVVARAIGPHVARDIQDYHFSSPPTARVSGAIPLQGEEGADLHFDLSGGPFHWWKFNVPLITGHVHWAGLHLSLTDVQAEFYHGVAAGTAAFDFPRDKPTEFQFNLNATNVLFQSLMKDLSPGTNEPEGRLEANLVITKANTDSSESVFGYGDAHLRDGLLWDIPLFGKFSPVLNGISPGLGNSRAIAATSRFVITNGVVRTSALEIRSTGMRLEYHGTVNLEGQLNARVDAELLRDMWLVGPVVSTVLWPVTKLFEYRVNGTLSDPRTEPVFIIPKIMLLPFHPFKALKGLKPEDPNSNPVFSPLTP